MGGGPVQRFGFSVSLHVHRVQATNLPLSISLPILEDETQLAANRAALLVGDLHDLFVGWSWHQYALPPVSIDYTFSHSYARLYDFLLGIFKVGVDMGVVLDGHVNFYHMPFLACGELLDLHLADLYPARCMEHSIIPRIGNKTIRASL